MSSGKVKCTCGWSWNKSDSSKKDMYICHECGRDNSNNMKNGGWLDNYGTQENYNDYKVSAPEGMVGDGFSNVGRNYSPAWGGSFQEGGEIPNAQSGRATRADSLAVFNNTRAIDDYYRKQGYVKEKVKDSKDYKERIKNRKEWVNSSQKYLKEAKNVPVDIFYTQTDKNKNIAEQKKYLKEAQKRLSETIDENNPKNYIKKLEASKKIFETKAKDIGRYVDEQNNLVEGKPSVEKFYSPIDENKFYQREQSQGFLDLRSPMPLYDKRITPQDLSRFKSPNSVLGEQLLDKIINSKNKKEREALEKQMDALVYSDNVEMYEYDPLAVMPFDMVPLEQQEERIRKYGSSGVPTSIIQQHPDWVNSNTKPISNPTKHNVEGLKPMNVAGLQDVDNRFETNLDIPTPVQRKPKYYNITDVNNQYGGGDTSYRVDSLDELRELPKEQWDRKITPQYQMGGNIYPVNYVPQAQGGMSMPGAVGFSYARIGAPSKGPRRNQTDVTDASAQNGKEMQYYREGLDWKPKSIGQEGTQVVNSRQKRGLDLLVKETNNAKKDREELNTTGQIKKPRSLHYKKLTPKQQPTLSQDKMSVVDRQKANNAMEQVNKEQLGVLERPLIYLASPEKVLGDIGVPGMETSEEDRQKIMVNRYNPYQSNEDRLKNTIEMGLGYVPEATVNTGLAMMGMENPTVGKLANEIFNPLAGIKTSISPELRQGLQTNGFLDMFKSKKPTNISGQDWLHKWNNDPITLNKIAEREKLSESFSHPRFEEAFPEYPVIREGQLADKELNDIKTKFINSISNERSFPINTDVKKIPVLSYEDLKINDPKTYEESINTTVGVSPGRGKVYIDDAQFKNQPSKTKESATVHELTHFLENNGSNLTINEQKELLAPFGKNNFQLDRPTWDGKIYDESYYTEPTEIHARMNEARFQLGLSPKDKFTEEMFNKVSKENNWEGMGEYIKDKKGFIDLMNNFWAVPPVVIGAGALQQTNQEEAPQMKKGGIIKDDRGQWEHPGEITEINSPYITMKGVPYPVLGISDTGDMQMMYPEEEYEFDGEKVTEYPMAKNGRRQEQKGLVNLDNLLNFTNYNKPQPGGWLNKYN